MRFFSIFLLLCILFANCTKEPTVVAISTKELKVLLATKNIELLDVRTPEETKLGYIKSAKFANFFDDDFTAKALQQVDTTKTIYVYCRSGNRSSKAPKLLIEKGCKVVNVSSGFKKWRTENSVAN